MCVSCELLLYFLRFIHFLFVFLFCAVPRDRELPLLSHFLFYMIEDILLLFRALFYVIEDILSSLYVLFSVEDGGCTCTCVRVHPCRRILYADLLFFPLFGEGLHRVSRYTSRVSRPLENSTFLLLLHHSFVTTPTSSFAFFLSVVSLRRFSPRSPSFE